MRLEPAVAAPQSASDTDLPALLEDSALGHYCATTDGRMLYANPAFLRITGLDSAGDFRRVNLRELGAQPGAWTDRMNQLQSRRSIHLPLVEIRHAKGQPIWVALTERLRTPPNSTEPVVDGLLLDVTERKRLELKLSEHLDELARSNRDLEYFAHTASHELQEPLRTVERYSRLLAEETRTRTTHRSSPAGPEL